MKNRFFLVFFVCLVKISFFFCCFPWLEVKDNATLLNQNYLFSQPDCIKTTMDQRFFQMLFQRWYTRQKKGHSRPFSNVMLFQRWIDMFLLAGLYCLTVSFIVYLIIMNVVLKLQNLKKIWREIRPLRPPVLHLPGSIQMFLISISKTWQVCHKTLSSLCFLFLFFIFILHGPFDAIIMRIMRILFG